MPETLVSTSPFCGSCQFVRWKTNPGFSIKCILYDEDLTLKHQGEVARAAKCRICLEEKNHEPSQTS